MGDELPIRRLLDVGRALVSDLDARAILDRVLNAAREITGASYAALGVLDESRTELAEFLTVGIDAATRRAIGEPPHGRGVLGVLIADPRPLRLADVSAHPRSYGFPEGHPIVRGFLGVPVLIRGEAWGNLYLGNKQDAQEFTDSDQESAVILAEWAGIAIENARLYERSEQRREELERAVRGLEATRDVAVAIGGATGTERVLELIAKRGRALIDARAVLIMLREGPDFVVVASAGYAIDVNGHRLSIADSTSGQVLDRGVPERIAHVAARLRITPAELGVPDARTALLVPMMHRGSGLGVLAAFDRGERAGPFTDSDEHLLQTFAASGANAVAIARSVEADRLRSSLAAADAERRRWARELHDDTLQVLGGLRILLSGTVRRADPDKFEAAMREAVSTIEQGIDGLRTIIADLRPAALDEIGLRPAIEALIERRRSRELKIEAQLELPEPSAADRPLEPELETTVYRLVQESLTNVVKHARANSVDVKVIATGDMVRIAIRDNGVGFDLDARTEGFGLAGIRERVYLSGGTLELESGERGTVLRAELPTHHRSGTTRDAMRGLV